jgi:hypothetical protein
LQEIGCPVLPVPARQAEQSDSQIIRYLHDHAATLFGQPHCFSSEIFRKYASHPFSHWVLLSRQTLSESPCTFPGQVHIEPRFARLDTRGTTTHKGS